MNCSASMMLGFIVIAILQEPVRTDYFSRKLRERYSSTTGDDGSSTVEDIVKTRPDTSSTAMRQSVPEVTASTTVTVEPIILSKEVTTAKMTSLTAKNGLPSDDLKTESEGKEEFDFMKKHTRLEDTTATSIVETTTRRRTVVPYLKYDPSMEFLSEGEEHPRPVWLAGEDENISNNTCTCIQGDHEWEEWTGMSLQEIAVLVGLANLALNTVNILYWCIAGRDIYIKCMKIGFAKRL